MAHNSYTYDQACELLGGWYRRMRIDNLADDEILNELQSRKVIMNPSLTNEQRCEMLRSRLTQEKSGEAEAGIRFVVGNSEAEIDTCTDRYEVLRKLMTPNVEEETRDRCQDRLIHLGIRLITVIRVTRGPSELLSSLQNKVVDLANLLYVFYEPPLPDPDTDTESEPDPPPPNPNKRDIGSVFNQDDLDFIHDLQAKIADLEGQLSYRKPTREMGTQTPRVSIPNDRGSLNTKTPFYSSADPMPNPTPTPYPAPNPIPPYSNFNDPSYNSHNSNYPGSSSFPQQNPYSYPSYNSFHPNHSQNPFNSHQPHLSYRPELPPLFNPSFNNKNSQFKDSTPPHQFNNRRSLPVSKWNIIKYSGDDQGLC